MRETIEKQTLEANSGISEAVIESTEQYPASISNWCEIEKEKKT